MRAGSGQPLCTQVVQAFFFKRTLLVFPRATGVVSGTAQNRETGWLSEPPRSCLYPGIKPKEQRSGASGDAGWPSRTGVEGVGVGSVRARAGAGAALRAGRTACSHGQGPAHPARRVHQLLLQTRTGASSWARAAPPQGAVRRGRTGAGAPRVSSRALALRVTPAGLSGHRQQRLHPRPASGVLEGEEEAPDLWGLRPSDKGS